MSAGHWGQNKPLCSRVTLLSPCPHLAELMEPLRKVGKKGSGEGELSVDVLVLTDRKKNNLDLSILLYSPKKKIKMKIQSYRLRENEATFSYGLKESRPSCKGPLAQLASGT